MVFSSNLCLSTCITDQNDSLVSWYHLPCTDFLLIFSKRPYLISESQSDLKVAGSAISLARKSPNFKGELVLKNIRLKTKSSSSKEATRMSTRLVDGGCRTTNKSAGIRTTCGSGSTKIKNKKVRP